jgi:TonB-dependent receptor
LPGNWGVNLPGDVPADMMEELNFASLFDGYRTSLTTEGQNFFSTSGLDLGGSNSGASAEVFMTGFIAKDVKALGKKLSADGNLPWAPNPDDTVNRTIQDDINSFFVQANYDLELGSMPLDIFAGVRYEDSDVKSISQVANGTIIWQGDNDLIVGAAGTSADAPVQSGDASYSHTLPSLALSLSLTEDLVGRFAYSKTIARPSYNNQLLGIGQIGTPQGGPTALGAAPGTAATGDPSLKPLESNNYDLSVEWYYGEGSYVSLGYFFKDVPNFIGNQVVEQQVLNTDGTPATRDPTNGPRVDAAIVALNNASIPVTQQSLFQMVASLSTEGEGCQSFPNADQGETLANSASCGDAYGDFAYEAPNGWEDNVDITAIESGPMADPAYVARVNTPIDNQSAELDGFELAVQHFFGETGFGVQANYTVVNGDIAFDITGDPTVSQFALLGLSDSANLVGIYENSGWSARLAYNWRDAFLANAVAAGNEPQFNDEYSQWDLNVGYDVTDNLSVSFEGLNLTGEDYRTYARTERQLLQLAIQDVRYVLGVRYTFE